MSNTSVRSAVAQRFADVFALLCLGVLVGGCLLSPGNDANIASTTSHVTFRGYVVSPNVEVVLLSSATKDGRYVPVATTRSASTPFRTLDGINLYAFATRAVIPAYSMGCSGKEAFVKATSEGTTLYTFNQADPNGLPPELCLAKAITEGESTREAVHRCKSDSSPIVRLTVASSNAKPTTYEGNITINDDSEAAAWSCLESLHGDLTIGAATAQTISLPKLTFVSGDVTLNYPRPSPATRETARTIDLPVLNHVDGDLTLLSPGPLGQLVTIHFGLPQLTTLGGNLSVDVDAFNSDLSGLPALSSLPRDLTIVTGTGDTFFHGFLAALTRVSGDVDLDLGHTLGSILTGLTTVDGSFILSDGNPTPSCFTRLSTVGEDMLISNIEFNMHPNAYAFPALTNVTRELHVTGMGKPNLRLGASSGLTVGALRVNLNPLLTGLDAGHLRLNATGNVVITNNVNLCSSLANAFVSGLSGFVGTSTVSGNGGC